MKIQPLHPAPAPCAAVRRRRTSRAAGLSIAELLIALSISVMLLTATMVATDTCFKTYAVASEQFSTLSSSRMVTNRVLSLIRNNTAHGPVDLNHAYDTTATSFTIKDPLNPAIQYNATYGRVTEEAQADVNNNPIFSSPYIEVYDENNDTIYTIAYITYTADGVQRKELWMFRNFSHATGNHDEGKPLLSDVTQCTFFCVTQPNPAGFPKVNVLRRAILDITIQPGRDGTLELEHGFAQPIRFVASTKPRKF